MQWHQCPTGNRFSTQQDQSTQVTHAKWRFPFIEETKRKSIKEHHGYVVYELAVAGVTLPPPIVLHSTDLVRGRRKSSSYGRTHQLGYIERNGKMYQTAY